MAITISSKDDITIIEIIEKLDGTNAPEAQGKIMPLVITDCQLIIDMKDCNYVSSAGLRVLLMMAKKLNSVKGKGVLANLSEDILDIMEMTGFDNMFENYDTLDDASKSFTKEK